MSFASVVRALKRDRSHRQVIAIAVAIAEEHSATARMTQSVAGNRALQATLPASYSIGANLPLTVFYTG